MSQVTMSKSTALLLFVFIAFAHSSRIPSTFKKCRVSPELDNQPNECLKSAVEDAVKHLSIQGSEELGVSDLDPLKVDEIVIDKGQGPVALNYVFYKSDIKGLNTLKVNSIDGKLSSAKDFKMYIKGVVKAIEIIGNYKINGKILILPIYGEGYSNVSIANVDLTCIITGDSQVKHGKEYLKITDFKLDLNPSKIIFDFENLFNGNKELADNMIKFMNENWNEIYKELKLPIEEAFSLLLKSYTQRVLERVSFKKIFMTQ